MAKIQITTAGIKKALGSYDCSDAIIEYIWNGFDAGASLVEIEFKASPLGAISEMRISDNGHGIQFESLASKFIPFFESDKEIDPAIQRNTSAVHGKNGVGRLTFFTFASTAKWTTTYGENRRRHQYEVTIHSDELNDYAETMPIETDQSPGTTVEFFGVHSITSYEIRSTIIENLRQEFGWFLELYAAKQHRIKLNGDYLDYSKIVGERENLQIESEGALFDIKYVRWNQNLKREFSRYYFINSFGEESHKETTTFNNKGDQFFHSVYVKSPLFDSFKPVLTPERDKHYESNLFSSLKSEKAFKELMTKLEHYLVQKRKPFLKESGDKLVIDLERNGAFPEFGDNEWDKFRKSELEEFIRELHWVEPKIFVRLNVEQQKTLVRLLNLVMDTGERDGLLSILSGIVEMSPAERSHLAETLRVTTLSNITKTIKLIEDRYRAISDLKSLVFSHEVEANERVHIQKAIENHYWVFGEQYHLVTAAEPKFEEALRRHTYLLRGEKKGKKKIDHPNKNMEMDIFMVRQQVIDGERLIKNVCVELKHPEVRLGRKQFEQVDKFLERVVNFKPVFRRRSLTSV